MIDSRTLRHLHEFAQSFQETLGRKCDIFTYPLYRGENEVGELQVPDGITTWTVAIYVEGIQLDRARFGFRSRQYCFRNADVHWIDEPLADLVAAFTEFISDPWTPLLRDFHESAEEYIQARFSETKNKEDMLKLFSEIVAANSRLRSDPEEEWIALGIIPDLCGTRFGVSKTRLKKIEAQAYRSVRAAHKLSE